MSKIIGIDISKQTFDVAFKDQQRWVYLNLKNETTGFRKLEKKLNEGDIVVMEASGPYHLQLANYLYSVGVKVVVENPLVIKRYSQMKLKRAKTDKKDAQTIAEYAQSNELSFWEPDEQEVIQIKQLHTAIEGLLKACHQISQQLEALKSTGMLDTALRNNLEQTLNYLVKKKAVLEKRQQSIVKKHYAKTFQQLRSIPCIGDKTATMLIVITNNFKKFKHYKQLIAYVGFSPRIYQSGTSVNGKGHICKMGKAQVRKLLYMCTWTAKFHNRACKEMYDRLIAKGKHERVIKIAIANKLLKMAFSIVKNDTTYNKDFQPKPCF
jgi:transposase